MRDQILKSIAVSAEEIADNIGIDKVVVTRELKAMCDDGELTRVKKNSTWMYSVVPTADTGEADQLRAQLASADKQIDDWIDATGENTPADAARLIASLKITTKEKKTAEPRKPRTTTDIHGYLAPPGSGKVTLFLGRRLSAKSVTLHTEDYLSMSERVKNA